jgi:Nitroreductase family.
MIGGTMDIIQAIEKRISCRAFTDQQVEQEKFDALVEEATRINEETGLHFQIFGPRADGTVINMSDKMFAGNPPCYAALVAKKDPVEEEKLGYYGERLVLLAQTLGLNSCWVGLSFRKQPDQYQIANGEKLHCVIALGYGANQGVQHLMRPMEQFVKVNGTMPEWFKRGMEAVLLAPTAVHQQKFEFELVDDHTVCARARFTLVGYGKMDLGIVKYHFEVGAGHENFSWL